ncbi:type IV secretion system DNA-binding domain-containing protein [Flavobacterium frigidarium]|uniref:type IV secretory system conjugative DNA transfer family protein n=1 Tax=Flavobacterium frigidarium TaxID=99286 RepID=UPI0030DC50BB|tara:strand:+ start:39 stop:1952 length:1914 start_codon:yes stop_codon:yes gene_type:complete
MAGEGLGIGELTSLGGLLFKAVKAFIFFSLIFSVLLIESHFLGFALLNLFDFKYNFDFQKLHPISVMSLYEKILYFFSKILAKLTFFQNLAVIIFVPSIVYCSYHHSKQKKFPRVIIGTIVNNTVGFLIIAFLASFFSKTIGKWSILPFVAPVIYAFYILKFKNSSKKLANHKFNNLRKNDTPESFTFQTNKGVIFLKNPYRGIYIQGGAGSGKSASIFEPIIQQIGEKQFSGILYDYKSPELTEKVFLSYEQGTIKVKNVDFKQPYLSDRVNPINPKYLLKSSVAIEYAQVIINNLLPETIKKNDFWSNNAKMILAGVIWFLRNEYPNYCTIPHVISLILHNPADQLIEKVSQDYEAAGMVASLRESIERGAERTVAGMLSTIQNALSVLNSHDIFWLLSHDDFDLHLNSKENPTFLCLGNDSTLPQTYTPVISLIISVALRQMNQPSQTKSVVLLDEAPTLFIPNIEQIPATGRSNKIATVFGVQDYSQLADKYGHDKAQVIISNLGNQFFGRVTNGKTAEMIQSLFGKADKTFVSKSAGNGTSGKLIHLGSNSNNGTSESIQERDRVKVNDMINLSQGEFYGIIAEGAPREFLKTQFVRSEINGTYVNSKIPVNANIIKKNYIRILYECKEIFK